MLKNDYAAIDVLGAGIVVAPPSPHPDTGQNYRWQPPFLSRQHVPMLPARVYELVEEAHRPTQPQLALVDGPIPVGQRERTLVSVFGAARRRGAGEDGLRALGDAENRRCEVPLSAGDIDRLARSVSRYEPDTLDVNALVATIETQPDPALEFVTPAMLKADSGVRVDYVLPPYLIGGTLTDLTGRAKIGKTRFRNFLIACAVMGRPCLGYPAVTSTPVVLLTEEPPASLLEGLEAAGLIDTDDVAILTRHAARSADWSAMVAAAIEKA